MKIKVIGYPAIALLVIGIVSFLVADSMKGGREMRNKKVITAVLSGKLTLPLGPENISTIPLYHVHANLWSTLLNSDGSPLIARITNRSSEQKSLSFEVLSGARFSDGKEITSDDIKFSFERLSKNQERGHFTPSTAIKAVVVESNRKFKIELSEVIPSIDFLLSIPETGIVPREACDTTGKITNLSITSGAYSVEGAPAENNIILVKNPHFLAHAKSSPEKVVLRFESDLEVLQKVLRDEKPDFFEIYEASTVPLFSTLSKVDGYDVKITQPSFSVFAYLNTKSLSKEARLAVATLFNSEHTLVLNPDLEKKSFEILPPKTFGALNLSKPLVSESDFRAKLPKSVSVMTTGSKSTLVDGYVDTLKKAGIEVLRVDENADISFSGQGMNVDFPEIEFNLSLVGSWAYIDASIAEKEEVEKLLHLAEKNTRSERIQALGKNLLADGRIIPILVRSYAHIFQKNRLNIDAMTDYDGDILFSKMSVVEP